MALLKAPIEALTVLVHTVSSQGDLSPWNDDSWGNKKIMPGGGPNVQSAPAFTQRVKVTPESFLLMVTWQANQHAKKLPQLRRKLEKGAMEEASSICAYVLSLKRDCLAQHPIPEQDLQKQFIDVFAATVHQQLVLFVQSQIHTMASEVDLENVPLLGDIIQKHIKKTDIATTGLPKTELINAQIDKTEFLLVEQKLTSDCSALDTFERRLRIESAPLQISLVLTFRGWWDP